jgi:hypothetical protein
MRKYYRKYLLYSLGTMGFLTVWVAIAVILDGWWSLATVPFIAWEAWSLVMFARAALRFRRYIGHPLEYLVLLHLELKL